MNSIDKVAFSTLKNCKFLDQLKGKTFFVTGATGLIGSSLIRFLLLANCEKKLNIRIIGLCRNEYKAINSGFYSKIKWCFQDMKEPIVCSDKIDFVIHTASPTDSEFFVTHPVETINTTLAGMNNLLLFSLSKHVSSFLFTSSMEVYGQCLKDCFIGEEQYFPIDCTNVRSSYAEGKKILECLAFSFGKEYGLPVKGVRLCQTFGPGVAKNDKRVFAQFGNDVINGKNITLNTRGETKRSYCSIPDAINGIITVLINGEINQVYNIASDKTYISIFDLARLFVKNTNLSVEINEQPNDKYLGTIKFGLDTTKIKGIGFKSNDDMNSIIEGYLEFLKEK
jgi:UDP-glucuronate decarboxylase